MRAMLNSSSTLFKLQSIFQLCNFRSLVNLHQCRFAPRLSRTVFSFLSSDRIAGSAAIASQYVFSDWFAGFAAIASLYTCSDRIAGSAAIVSQDVFSDLFAAIVSLYISSDRIAGSAAIVSQDVFSDWFAELAAIAPLEVFPRLNRRQVSICTCP